MYLSGEGGLDIDYNEVWSWIRKLAEQGYDTAQAWLGVQYSKAEQYNTKRHFIGTLKLPSRDMLKPSASLVFNTRLAMA